LAVADSMMKKTASNLQFSCRSVFSTQFILFFVYLLTISWTSCFGFRSHFFKTSRLLHSRHTLHIRQNEVFDDRKLEQNIGVIIVDHGSKRAAANEMLEEVVERFKSFSGRENVQVAHMEIVEPSISQAFDACVAKGATAVIVHPFFLSPGKHATKDIPALLKSAAAKHPNIPYSLANTMGLHPLMSELISCSVNDAIDDLHVQNENAASLENSSK